ncbi:MAG: methyl-accepting chemotaxis protein [Sporomusaceae bacterium]|nr:methyl-accepting chemotaxis protein [Sporomusaceae bacterium]
MQIRSVRAKFLITLLPLFMISFAILAGASYYLANQHLTKNVKDTAVAIGEKFATQISSEMHEKMVRLDDLAAIPEMQAGTREQKVAILSAAKTRLGTDFDSIFFINPDGSAVGFDGKSYNYSDREYFSKVKATQLPYSSKPLISKSTGKLALVLVTPVKSNGQLIGMIGGTISLENLSLLLKDLQFKDTGYGYLVDNSGVLIAHYKTPATINKLNLTEKKVPEDLNLPMKELDDRLMQLFKTAVDSGKTVSGTYTGLTGIPNVAVFTPITLDGGNKWIMIVTAPEAEVTREARSLLWSTVILSCVFLLIAVIAILFIVKRFTKPLQFILQEALQLAEGDLRERAAVVQSQDEIGRLAQGFCEMRTKLRQLMQHVKGQSEKVAGASEQLTESAHQSASAANQVAEAVTTIAAGTDKQADAAATMAETTRSIAESTGNIVTSTRSFAQMAHETSVQAEQGRESLNEAVAKMEDIRLGSEAVQTAIGELAKGSNEINEIVNLISAISGQTNLLALNAAIEAARAGEQGRGFAVVAEEVRKLAEESNQAAGKISELIRQNDMNMKQAILKTEVSVESIQGGIESVNGADLTFRKIVEAVVYLSQEIQKTAHALEETATKNDLLVTASKRIEDISKENSGETQTISAATEEQSASMEEVAAASRSLSDLAKALEQEIQRFKL